MAIFEVGMKIFVDVPVLSPKGDTPDKASLTSVIEEIIDKETILIQMPTYQGNYFHMSSLDSISIRFPTKTSIFAFDAKYHGTIQRGLMTLARMQRVSPLEERQLRDCFRLPCFIPARFQKYWPSENPKAGYRGALPETSKGGVLNAALQKKKSHAAKPEDFFKGHLLDLSDGGALLATEEVFERGDKLTLEFGIGFYVHVECRALRVFGSTNHNYPYCVGLSFASIGVKEKERIYQYLVNEQIKQRKR